MFFRTKQRLFALEDRVAALEPLVDRVASLERQLQELRTQLAQDPAARARLLAGEIGAELEQGLAASRRASEIASQIDAIRAGAERSARGEAARAERWQPRLNEVYPAEWTGYLSLYFDGGRTDIVELYVGLENPPRTCVCKLNSMNDINSYAGTVVRKGEYFLALSAHKRGSDVSGVRCELTPFF